MFGPQARTSLRPSLCFPRISFPVQARRWDSIPGCLQHLGPAPGFSACSYHSSSPRSFPALPGPGCQVITAALETRTGLFPTKVLLWLVSVSARLLTACLT